MYIISNFLARLPWTTLRRSKQKCVWQHLTISTLLIWNNFMKKNLFTTKSKEF